MTQVELPEPLRAATVGQGADAAAAAAGDSITVAAWTIVSRVTGVAKFACIGAVLGPTFFGNTYQFTNSLPNLVYYGFLAGSLFSSLLVPALVRHIDAGDRRASERVAGGFLGITLVALLLIAPVAITLGPLVLRFASLTGASPVVGAAQENVGRLLIVMFIPQIFCYGVVGTATAVMNSRQRFALAAGAPAVENLGTIAVLVAVAVLYGTGTRLGSVPSGEMLLLGLGSTGAVAAHAATQWWGARRAGVLLMPRPGWRDSEVRVVVARALPSLAQAGLLAFQGLTLLVVANRLPGGGVAFQIALNFYYLAISLGATPVALSLPPRLARVRLGRGGGARWGPARRAGAGGHAGARTVGPEVRGGSGDHGGARLAHRHIDLALGRTALRPASRDHCRCPSWLVGVLGRAGPVADPRTGLGR